MTNEIRYQKELPKPLAKIDEYYIQKFVNGILAITQNLEVGLTAGKNNNVINIQRIEVNCDPRSPNPELMEAVLDKIQDLGGIKEFYLHLFNFTIEKYDGNVSKAARVLDIDRRTMSQQLKEKKK